MKQKLIAVTFLFLGIAIVCFIFFRSPEPGKVDAQKIFTAAQTYTRQLKSQSRIIPESVNLKELIAIGLLQPSDVSGFSGADVTVFLLADLNSSNAVLMRALFSDGQEMVVTGDGNIQMTR